MSDLWRVSREASDKFSAQATDYDRHRPRYPGGVVDDMVAMAGLSVRSRVIEIGAGTGIATEMLVERGLSVTAIEPASALRAVAASKVGGRVHFVEGQFEDFVPTSAVPLVTAFNAWHWVDPSVGTDLAARLIEPGGSLALVWTEVVSWGQEPFEDRLADVFGSPWTKRMDHVDLSMLPVVEDPRFDVVQIVHHPFERTMDGRTFVAVSKTYGGTRTEAQYQAIERIIDEEFGGSVTKAEDAALYISRRLA
jgi:trans-aconitate methyltransferase